jgi:hypothetical protein
MSLYEPNPLDGVVKTGCSQVILLKVRDAYGESANLVSQTTANILCGDINRNPTRKVGKYEGGKTSEA